VMLTGCYDSAISCGDESTTNQCKKIIAECSKYAAIAPDPPTNKALGYMYRACRYENKFSPTCDSCKRVPG